VNRAVLISASLAAAVLGLTPAQGWAAGVANRVWVSGKGADAAGCGSPIAPCRSLQYAHDNVVVAGGEIDILDPAGYGAVTITKALSIVNDGVGTAGVQASSGAAITVNAGPGDAVFLKGLNIDGVHQSGSNGISLAAAGSLTVVDCVVRHFSLSGISLEPTSSANTRVLIAATIVSDNESIGLISEPQAGGSVTGVIDHLIVSNNGGGITLIGGSAIAGSAFTLSNVNSSDNAGDGVTVATVGSPNTSVNIDSSYFDNNGGGVDGNGLSAIGRVVVRVSRSVLDANASNGISNGTTSTGAVYSAGNNQIDGNLSGALSGVALVADAPR
jgi:hypothetical protein